MKIPIAIIAGAIIIALAIFFSDDYKSYRYEKDRLERVKECEKRGGPFCALIK